MQKKCKALFTYAWFWLAEKIAPTADGDGEPNLGRRMLLTKTVAAAAVVFLGLSTLDTAEAGRRRRRRRRSQTRTDNPPAPPRRQPLTQTQARD